MAGVAISSIVILVYYHRASNKNFEQLSNTNTTSRPTTSKSTPDESHDDDETETEDMPA
jgi:hypothetical protein